MRRALQHWMVDNHAHGIAPEIEPASRVGGVEYRLERAESARLLLVELLDNTGGRTAGKDDARDQDEEEDDDEDLVA